MATKPQKPRRAPLTRKQASKRGVGARGAKPAAASALDATVERALASFAHDVRTPLTGILALAELLAASDLDERERRWVASLKGAAEHLAALTSVVVDAARADAKGLVARRDPFDLRHLIAQCGASLAARTEARGLTCRLDVAADLPQRALGDPVRLRTLIENVADNAVKFTERGSVDLKASVTPVRGGRLRLRVAISDTGIGLTAAEIKRLFRPFAQANADVGRRFGGAGLGLALVKRVARALGGDLIVRSTPGRGSTFTLGVLLDRAPAAPATATHMDGVVRLEPLKLLCVEDNPYARVVMNTILTELGHAVDFAATGEAACAAVAKRPYDAVLMDIELSGIDGLEATRRIRALPGKASRVPVVAISGHGDSASEAAARAAGLDGYVAKPVSPGVLMGVLAALVGER